MLRMVTCRTCGDSIANALLSRQAEAIEHTLSTDRPSFVVLELRFDETHHEMRLPDVSSFGEQ